MKALFLTCFPNPMATIFNSASLSKHTKMTHVQNTKLLNPSGMYRVNPDIGIICIMKVSICGRLVPLSHPRVLGKTLKEFPL